MKLNFTRFAVVALAAAVVFPNLANAAGFVRKTKSSEEVIKEMVLEDMKVEAVQVVDSFCGSPDKATIYAVTVPVFGRNEEGAVVEVARKTIKTFAVTKMDAIYGRAMDTQACAE